jgi:cytochrome b pre-mRNA-processing protein 3
MFERIFGRRKKSANREIVDRLYDQIVAAARQPVLYSHWEVPDTPLGRFEMVALHLYLFLHRVRGETEPAAAIAQDLTDEFFRDMEHSMRELGVSDVGVPKRMKRLARMFYGRAKAYDAAIDGNDRPALAEALRRNIRPDAREWPQAAALADYAFSVADDLAGQALELVSTGSTRYPAAPPGGGEQRDAMRGEQGTLE